MGMKNDIATVENILAVSFSFKFIYLFLRERERDRESTCRGGTERRDRIPSRLCTISTEPDAGLELTNCEIMN